MHSLSTEVKVRWKNIPKDARTNLNKQRRNIDIRHFMDQNSKK
jgi:hypothetical protein